MAFTMDHWVIHPDWIEPMQLLTVLPTGTTTFEAHLFDSMLKLTQAFGEPLRHEANLLTNANAPLPNPPGKTGHTFGADDMTKYLKNGDFKFSTGNKRLFIAGPTEDMITKGVNGRAPKGENFLIRINIFKYVARAQNNEGGFFPENNDGLQNFKTILGKVILHEMLHREGFKHAKKPAISYTPSDAYYRTFPEVAEQAYFNLRKSTFPAGTTTAFNLVGGLPDANCDTVDE